MLAVTFARAAALAFLVVCGACSEEQPTPIAKEVQAAPSARTMPVGSGFDFYVLSLSWSPSYCEAEGAGADRQQCASARPYAFVVHGLWPQFERGFPQDCPTNPPDVPRETLSGLYDIMPSAGLIRHEWRTHGGCSGLSQDDYFETLRKAREKVVVPAAFGRLTAYKTIAPADAEAEFLRANPSVKANGLAVTCDKRFLREIRICMTRELGFRPCPEVDRRACRLPKVVMPPVRGG